jgi:AGCS family alanine or glycine:cation symporter
MHFSIFIGVLKTITTMNEYINQFFQPVVNFLDDVLFWDPFAAVGIILPAKFPFIIVWLIAGALFFTLYLRFVNVSAFGHAIGIVLGKYDKKSHSGEISHFQALATATASTVGLGNIAGVAVAISMGGPGATFWLIIAGFLGMTTKLVECTLGVKYRKINPDGSVSGGPMYYLRDGLAKKGWKRAGKILAILFAIFASVGAFGIGNMFQSNQMVAQTVSTFPVLEGSELWMGLAVALLTGIVILGGIKGIARVNDKLFPLMAGIYLVSALIVIGVNFQQLDDAFIAIIRGAFTAEGIQGGVIGVMIIGFRRAAFSNEAGIGSAAIAHSSVKTEEPITEGFVALLEPFIDTVVVCTLTALVIITSGLSTATGIEGAQLTSAAFATVSDWFPYLLLPTILLFAYTTIISWSYYGVKSFDFLAGDFFERKWKKRILATRLYQLVYLVFTALGAVLHLNAVVDFSDMLILAMAVPNIIGLYILAPEVKQAILLYKLKRKSGV